MLFPPMAGIVPVAVDAGVPGAVAVDAGVVDVPLPPARQLLAFAS